MATIPDWKLQLLARRRQEEAAVRGREKVERERLSQMPAWKRGLLERRRAKLGLSPGEPNPASGTTAVGPPDPDKSAVLLEAIGPVHQNRFIQQERQQQQQQQHRSDELFAERRPGTLEAREWRLSPGEMRDPSPKERESREEQLSPKEARERRLEVGGAEESSLRPLGVRDGRQAGDRIYRLSETQKWRLSPAETPERSLRLAEPQEQSPRRKELVESRLSPPESDSQQPGLTEAHKWRPDSRESQEQSLIQLESSEWRPSSGEERKGCSEECGRREDRPAPRMAPEEITGLSETLTRRAPASSSGGVQAAEQRPSPVEDGKGDLSLTEGWRWTLYSGKVREWTPRDTETQTQKPAPPESAEKHLGPLGAETGEVEAEKEVGAKDKPLSTLQNRCSVPCPLPPEDAGTGGSRQQEEEAGELQPPPAAPLSPSPASPAPQLPGDPLMSRLFYGVKAGPGVGAPRRSGHTFTVNPRRSVPPAAPATPGTTDAAVPGAGKKRYPTAEEILVLGGYLRLSRSCLVKGSPERHHKQLKISFSETALETTYQYPSESSVLEELGPDPEAPNAPRAPAAQPDEDDDEEEEEEVEEEELQPELRGGLRTKALIVDESCRR
ncbi:phostensin [Pteronotus mesoamericanus]|uniref:phostensin n=1 Tax=Pteronotus mesoamericanus TaxID=1884717 RepID=UPI0023EDB110|nr:phostensin [Pteronotus parnellii mesoamericanus]